MATREENLKKINAELAQLSDEELEKVAGGFYARSIGGDGEKKPDVNNDNQSRKIIHVRRFLASKREKNLKIPSAKVVGIFLFAGKN